MFLLQQNNETLFSLMSQKSKEKVFFDAKYLSFMSKFVKLLTTELRT